MIIFSYVARLFGGCGSLFVSLYLSNEVRRVAVMVFLDLQAIVNVFFSLLGITSASRLS